jgi:hypothetical protein
VPEVPPAVSAACSLPDPLEAVAAVLELPWGDPRLEPPSPELLVLDEPSLPEALAVAAASPPPPPDDDPSWPLDPSEPVVLVVVALPS